MKARLDIDWKREGDDSEGGCEACIFGVNYGPKLPAYPVSRIKSYVIDKWFILPLRAAYQTVVELFAFEMKRKMR